MTKQLLFFISLLIVHSASSQYCMSGGPSTEQDSNLEALTLNGATGSINYTGCNGPTQGVTGVEEWLSQTAYINAGSAYTVSLLFGTCGGNYPGNGQAWIDFNINGIFEASESIGTWTGTPPTLTSAFNFTVPSGATTGQSRMRVMQAENSTLPLNPCASFTWGSVTDFSVFIQNGVDCSSYIGDDETDPRDVPAIPFSETHDNSVCYTNQNPVYFSPDVYYLVKPDATTAEIEVSLCGSSFDTFLSVMDTDGNIIAINDDHPDCGTSSKLSVSTIGHDSLYIIVEGWGLESGSYTINIDGETLSIDEVKELKTTTIFPNPASTYFEINNEFKGEVIILDALGNLVKAVDHQMNSKIDIAELKTGVYFIRLKSDNQITTKKLIVE